MYSQLKRCLYIFDSIWFSMLVDHVRFVFFDHLLLFHHMITHVIPSYITISIPRCCFGYNFDQRYYYFNLNKFSTKSPCSFFLLLFRNLFLDLTIKFLFVNVQKSQFILIKSALCREYLFIILIINIIIAFIYFIDVI